MRDDDVMTKVQQRGELTSREEAVRAVEVVLSTLGERLYRTAREHLGAQLPTELKALLWQRRGPEQTPLQGEHYGLHEFYARVQARADLSRREAERRSRVVMDVLHEAVSEGEWQELRDALPSEYGELLGSMVEAQRP